MGETGHRVKSELNRTELSAIKLWKRVSEKITWVAVATCLYRYMRKIKCNRYAGGGIATTLITVVNACQS